MNILAIMAAGAGLALLLLSVHFGRQQARRWQRLAHLAAGLVLASGGAAMVPVMFGDTSERTVALALEYLAWAGAPGLALAMLLPGTRRRAG